MVSDIDEIELEKQLQQLEAENREVAGDSDEEDDVEGMGELEGEEPGEEEEGEDWWGGSKYNLYLSGNGDRIRQQTMNSITNTSKSANLYN